VTSSYDGFSFVVVAAFLLLLPALLAGAIRSATGAGMALSFALAVTFTGLLTWVAVPHASQVLRARLTGSRSKFLMWTLAQLAPLVVATFVIARLANRDFSGFMNIDGWDGGSHLFLKQAFVQSDSTVYNGFVGQYAFSYVLERIIGFDSFRAVAITFYAAIAICVALPTAFLFYVIEEDESPVLKLLAAGIGVASLLWVAHSSFLPLFHYLQGMGDCTDRDDLAG
jgi:hypothetical protein